ncbi:MAG: hypothetical protein J7539_13695 [Niabella sp.]|nr:hypothetical protein [Niabella sp.]
MNKIKALLIIKAVIFSLALPGNALSQNKEPVINPARKLPVIIDFLPETNKKLSTNSVTVAQTTFMFLEAYADTVRLHADRQAYLQSTYWRNRYYTDSRGIYKMRDNSSRRKSGLEIFADTTQCLTIDLEDYSWFRSTVYLPSEGYRVDSVKTKELYARWLQRPRNYIQAVPVFLANNTNDTLFLDFQDHNALMIQEALDENGNWRPIEYWQYSKCGNSYGETGILPHYFIMVKVNKYYGDFETLLRVKLRNGEKVIYSNSFKGSINKAQFAPQAWGNDTDFPDPLLNRLSN